MEANPVIELLANRLPAQALHFVREHQHFMPDADPEQTVNDLNIADLLREAGTNVDEVVNDTLLEVMQALHWSIEDPSLFDNALRFLGDGLNPFIEPVRQLLQQTFSVGD